VLAALCLRQHWHRVKVTAIWKINSSLVPVIGVASADHSCDKVSLLLSKCQV